MTIDIDTTACEAVTREAMTWPLSRLGEGIEELVRRSGLRPTTGEPLTVPESAWHDRAELQRWFAWVGDRLGVEAKPVEAAAPNVPELVMQAGPAVIRIEGRE